MPIEFNSLSELLEHGFDTLIDVRSPAEFAEDHIPGAVNMPALSNEERAEVGTIYKQISAFEAKKVGAALVARNVATAIETQMQDKSGPWRPLVYCWRGGQRSGSFSTILSQIGWRSDTIAGGYQTFRKLVHRDLYDIDLPHRLILLDGNTGTAKTAILEALSRLGVQTVDLEGMARHRGSLLGGYPSGQPSQKAFETLVACAFAGLDPARPVVVEAESSKIGNLNVPPKVWAAMCVATRIEVEAPIEARAAYLTMAYADVIADTDDLRSRIQPIRQLRGHEVVNKWEALLSAGDHLGLAKALMEDHYDPAYAKSRATHDAKVLGTVRAEVLDTDGIAALARAVAALTT